MKYLRLPSFLATLVLALGMGFLNTEEARADLVLSQYDNEDVEWQSPSHMQTFEPGDAITYSGSVKDRINSAYVKTTHCRVSVGISPYQEGSTYMPQIRYHLATINGDIVKNGDEKRCEWNETLTIPTVPDGPYLAIVYPIFGTIMVSDEDDNIYNGANFSNYGSFGEHIEVDNDDGGPEMFLETQEHRDECADPGISVKSRGVVPGTCKFTSSPSNDAWNNLTLNSMGSGGVNFGSDSVPPLRYDSSGKVVFSVSCEDESGARGSASLAIYAEDTSKCCPEGESYLYSEQACCPFGDLYYYDGVASCGGCPPNTWPKSFGSNVCVNEKVIVCPLEAVKPVGETQQFELYHGDDPGLTNLSCANVTATQNRTEFATWESQNTGVATVSDTAPTKGLATVIDEGEATITGTFNGLSADAQIASPSFIVCPSSATLEIGNSRQFNAYFKNGGGATCSGSTVNWQSDWETGNVSAATVNNSGRAKAEGVGTTSVTATYTRSRNTYTDTASLTVSPPACVPDTSCAAETCIGETCEDGCGGYVDGTKDCDNDPPDWREIIP